METMNLKNYAHLGDAVWELHVREIVVESTGNSKKMHEMTVAQVNCGYQAHLLQKISDKLTEEEQDLVRRGRNLSIPIARRQNQNEYRQATAFEVLIGWWYKHAPERLNSMFALLDND